MYGMHQGTDPPKALSKYAPLEASSGNMITNIASVLGCILFYLDISGTRTTAYSQFIFVHVSNS